MMTATTASDPSGVEYYFTNTTIIGGSHDSGWQVSPTYNDTGLDPATEYFYTVRARDGSAAANETDESSTASATTAAFEVTYPPVYEPFDYPAGGLNGASGASEIGWDGAWTANSTSLVGASTLSYGTLPSTGGAISGLSGSQNRYGGVRTVSASALDANGLLDDGAVLWFSVIMGYDSGGNRTNARLVFALADESLNTGNGSFYLNTPGATGLGVNLGVGPTGTFAATQVRDSTFGTGTAGLVIGNLSSAILPGSPNTNVDAALIVGKITWGATPADPDLIELFAPATDLAFPDTSSPISTLSVTVDQSGYDSITWGRGDKHVMDEIRFGSSYYDVIQADLVTTPDALAPTPETASFAVLPEPLPDGITPYSVTMTATVANDPSEVEYLFTETTNGPGADDSGWQASPTYIDTGLDPDTLYTYTLQTRDKSVANNTGTASAGVDVTTFPVDNVVPTPNPMTFASVPTTISNTAISMTASIATDNVYDVEYFFDETSGNPGGSDSGWQSSPTYIDDGLDPSTSYTYTVTARDVSPALNAGTASGPESASTVATDDTAPTPDPATWATVPTAVSDTEITMTATTATDDQYGVEYYFANRSINDGSHDSGWQASPTYNDTGLDPFTSYTYQVTVRDTSYNNNETDLATAAVVTDPDPAVVVPTLSEGPQYIIASQNSGGTAHDISVVPGAARYSGTTGANGAVYSSFGDGTVLDYRLFQEGPGETIQAYSFGAAGLISDVTSDDTSISNGSNADVWTTTDPGDDFTANSADFTSATSAGGIAGTVSGTIDISGMTEGIIYFAYGCYRNRPNIDLIMSGPGQTPVTLDNAGDADSANNTENYIAAVNFLNAGDYDTISYAYNTTNGTITGVILDGEATITPTNPYDDWAADAGNSFLGTLTDSSASLDFDGGGLATGIEWVVGGDPTDPSDDAGKAPISDNSDPDFFIFTYNRTDVANTDGNTTIKVEYGSDLTGWTEAVDDATNVIITETDNGATDSVEVKLLRSNFGSPLFARLNVVITP